MTYGDSTHPDPLDGAPDRGDPDGPVWMSPTGRHLTADLPVLAMALMLAEQPAGQIRTTGYKPVRPK